MFPRSGSRANLALLCGSLPSSPTFIGISHFKSSARFTFEENFFFPFFCHRYESPSSLSSGTPSYVCCGGWLVGLVFLGVVGFWLGLGCWVWFFVVICFFFSSPFLWFLAVPRRDSFFPRHAAFRLSLLSLSWVFAPPNVCRSCPLSLPRHQTVFVAAPLFLLCGRSSAGYLCKPLHSPTLFFFVLSSSDVTIATVETPPPLMRFFFPSFSNFALSGRDKDLFIAVF